MSDGMKGIARSLQIFESLAESGPIGVSDLARQIGLPKSTVHRHLAALAEAGWVATVGDESRKWMVTSRALMIGQRGSREGSIAAVALGPMRALRDQIDETITLQVPIGSFQTLHVERIESRQPVRSIVQLGMVSFITVTSGGLAILAHLSESEIDEALRRDIPKRTPETMRDPLQIRAALAQVREHGYSISRGQNRPGISGMAAPILDARHAPIAAVGITVPEGRFTDNRLSEWGTRLVETAAEIASRV